MADNYAIFSCNSASLSNARIRQALEGARVQFFAEDETHTAKENWTRFDIRLPDVKPIKVERIDVRHPEFLEQLQKQVAFIEGAAGADMGGRQSMLRERILRTRILLKMTGPPECAEKMESFAKFLAAQSNALLFYDSSLWDPRGRLCLAGDGTFDAESGWDILPSAIERKTRSEERLRASMIPVQESLSPIEADEECQLRPPWEVARRATALVTVAARAEGLEQQRALQFLQAWGLWEAASPREQAFLANPQPAESERIQCLWRYECLWVMLWALGHVEHLGMPTTICDVRRAVKTVTGMSPEVFIGQ